MRNVCKVGLPQAIGDVISSIGIDIGTAAVDSIKYRAPARYRSNPGFVCTSCLSLHYYHLFAMGDQLRWALCLSGNPPLCVFFAVVVQCYVFVVLWRINLPFLSHFSNCVDYYVVIWPSNNSRSYSVTSQC